MSQPSPAWLRFGFAADDTHIRLQVLKCRGRLLTRPLITLDRAAVQARLYGHLQAAEALNAAVKSGFSTAQTLQFSPLPSRRGGLGWGKQLAMAATHGVPAQFVPLPDPPPLAGRELVGTH